VVRVVVLVGAVVALVLMGLVWTFQRHLIYLPAPTPGPTAAEAIPGARDVVLQTSDGLRLSGWWVPAGEPVRDVAVLVANGNAGNRAARAPLAHALSERGLSVLLFDYRGFGGNPGRPTEDGLARDVRAAREFLLDRAGFPPNRVLYYGESLGAAVVTELATEHPPAGMLLRSPFVDLASVGQTHYPFLPVETLLRDRYPVAEQIAQVRVPVTVLYGDQDSIVPPDQSRAVAEQAPELQRLVGIADADHNDAALLDGDTLLDAVVALADAVDERA